MGTVRWEQYHKDDQIFVKEIHKVVVHSFQLGDVEDPDLYAAEPMYNWEKSEQGQFVMEHAIDKPEWRRYLNHSRYGYEYTIVAELEVKKLSEFYLKWGSVK